MEDMLDGGTRILYLNPEVMILVHLPSALLPSAERLSK